MDDERIGLVKEVRRNKTVVCCGLLFNALTHRFVVYATENTSKHKCWAWTAAASKKLLIPAYT